MVAFGTSLVWRWLELVWAVIFPFGLETHKESPKGFVIWGVEIISAILEFLVAVEVAYHLCKNCIKSLIDSSKDDSCNIAASRSKAG